MVTVRIVYFGASRQRDALVKFDSMLDASPGGITNAVARAEADGYEGGWVIETAHDPFLLLATAAATRTPLHLGTAVAVAFDRTPMLLALAGNACNSPPASGLREWWTG